MKKRVAIIIFTIIMFILVIVLFYLNINKKNNNSIDVIDINDAVHTDNTSIDWDTYSTYDLEVEDNKDINITEKGIYTLSGIINGKVIINTKGNVKLILDNVTINSNNGPCILISNAANVVIELKDDTINTLTDSTNYNDYTDEEATILSHDDLIIEGNGTLKINANYQDGIVSKDDLTINSGTFIINSVDDGIRGKDSVYIKDGNFTITSGGDAIKATNDEESDKGSIVIDSGEFNIVSGLDGIQASNKIIISNGVYNISTGGGSINSSTNTTWGRWGDNKSTKESSSAKGIKAVDNIVIYSGTFNLDTSDDSIHSNNNVVINNGEYIITSGDDGIHADSNIIVENGYIDISKSYEGIEAENITINNGNIKVLSSDDGFNAAGGNDGSANDRPGANNFNSNSNSKLTINGGVIYVNSTGDGLDANGSIYINGGNITVDGPTDSGNGSLDYDKELVITNGSLIAVGSSGMAQGISDNSTIYGVLANLSYTYKEGTKIVIEDSNGNEIINYTANKKFSSITVANTIFEKGKTYKILLDGEEDKNFTISSISTTVGNITGPGQMPNGGRR